MMERPRPPEQREPSNHASERDRRGSAVICGEARVTEKADDQCDGARCAVPMAPKRHCTWRRVREITDHHDGETDALTSAPHLAAHESTRDATTERPRHPHRRASSDHASRRDQRGSQRGARRMRRPGASAPERRARGTWRSPAHHTWRRTREHEKMRLRSRCTRVDKSRATARANATNGGRLVFRASGHKRGRMAGLAMWNGHLRAMHQDDPPEGTWAGLATRHGLLCLGHQATREGTGPGSRRAMGPCA